MNRHPLPNLLPPSAPKASSAGRVALRLIQLPYLRYGAIPVELVDGTRRVALMERLNLGVRPRTVFEVDLKFFEDYR